MATIIILNGTSSAGKSTLAKALQAKLDQPYLHAGIDNYIFMLPKQYLNQPLWSTVFKYQYNEDGTLAKIETGSMGNQLISAMHQSVKAIADVGFNVIVDHVLLEKAWLQEMVRLFSQHRVWFIGVRCPLEVVEQREKDRKDRTLGQAKAQFDVVHKDHLYDFDVDTSLTSSEESAEHIKRQLYSEKQPNIFASLRQS